MVARAAALCGWDTERTQEAVQNILSQFDDYLDTAVWARSSLAFCYEVGILDDAELMIGPDVPVLRCEIAQMLWNLLGLSNLL